ncbi:hypothetical protein BS50DRAFT_309142 [Corynespora cassiicola Philippines]|uniref:Uncharacterized protein n=1 Tax=Corynespora cassiicola Philippines TaxID=1448308 RepID=A0A2T2NXU3_CORCC|nr:hypothetical protein BS50DRAFT_309142 [Corynespora cassiicola Philippines]
MPLGSLGLVLESASWLAAVFPFRGPTCASTPKPSASPGARPSRARHRRLQTPRPARVAVASFTRCGEHTCVEVAGCRCEMSTESWRLQGRVSAQRSQTPTSSPLDDNYPFDHVAPGLTCTWLPRNTIVLSSISFKARFP